MVSDLWTGNGLFHQPYRSMYVLFASQPGHLPAWTRRFHRGLDGCPACIPTRNGILALMFPRKKVPDCTDHPQAIQPYADEWLPHAFAAIFSPHWSHNPAFHAHPADKWTPAQGRWHGFVRIGRSLAWGHCESILSFRWRVPDESSSYNGSVVNKSIPSHRWRSTACLLDPDIAWTARYPPWHETSATMSGSIQQELSHPGECGSDCRSVSFGSQTNFGHSSALWAGWLRVGVPEMRLIE